MQAEADRVLAVDRVLEDVRRAARLLPDRDDLMSWRGPAHDAFVQAFDALPPLLRAAEAALERERNRALLLSAGPGRTEL